MNLSRQAHPIFQKYPLDGQVTINGEQLSTPYHVYDGTMLLVGGTVDAALATKLLAAEAFVPVLDTAGRCLAAVWVCDFSQANLGPHQELQVSLLATTQIQPALKSHPLAFFKALSAPETRMVCHGLWNNTARVVQYNTEHLCLNAQRSESEINYFRQQWQFSFRDAAGNMLVEGHLAHETKQSLALLWQMLRQIGLQGMSRLARSPYLHVPVVNTRHSLASKNLVAHTYTRADKSLLRLFEPASDQLLIHHPLYATLMFHPAFVQQLEGVRFVYQRPLAELSFKGL